MKSLDSKRWIIIYLIAVLASLVTLAFMVIRIDPWMYYHKPLSDDYHYKMGTDEERLINFGIAKNFDYDAIITGTSMTENFKASECNQLFGVETIKVPLSGGKYNRLNDLVEKGLKYHPDTKIVIRGIDSNSLMMSEETFKEQDVSYPMYLINEKPQDDINYLLSKEVILNYCFEMIVGRLKGIKPGIVSFDDYARWSDDYKYGKDVVLSGRESFSEPSGEGEQSSDKDIELVAENVKTNVVSLTKEYPNTQFYYFYPPYSVVYWGDLYEKGELKRQINIERIATRIILESGCQNIHLFGFADRLDVTANLDNYKDPGHYGEKINSLILNDMHQGTGLLTEANYNDYYDKLLDLYTQYDYNELLK